MVVWSLAVDWPETDAFAEQWVSSYGANKKKPFRLLVLIPWVFLEPECLCVMFPQEGIHSLLRVNRQTPSASKAAERLSSLLYHSR